MLAALASTTWDPIGYVLVDLLPSVPDGDTRRRVTRSATLDGGVAINDGGFAEGDRVLVLRWEPKPDLHRDVERLMQLYSRLHVATRAGVYLAAPEVYSPGPNEASLRLLVVQKVSDTD